MGTKMLNRKYGVILLFGALSITVTAQKVATLEVDLPEPTNGLDIPVCINLDEITYISDTLLSLFEVKGDKRSRIPYQIEPGEERLLYWVVTGSPVRLDKRVYELSAGKPENVSVIKTEISKGSLTFEEGRRMLLRYQFGTLYPPPGIDTSYKRSGFVHPLWAPEGQVLTRIQPPDHYHHYGIWNPWTHVEYEGDTIDFWNLNARQGTVRFAHFVSVTRGSVFGELQALHQHVAFMKNGDEKIVMNELQSIRVFRTQENPECFAVDFNFRLNCAGESPVKLLEYRYAGLGWRTTEKWDNKNSMVLTSEGNTRKDADGSKARWCIVQGEIDNDYAGVVMMSFPTNYNYPEPLRIWPENQNGRGDMFANFCPTKNMDWCLAPGQNYVLKYRFLVFNGHMDAARAECAWYYFAHPPVVSVIKSDTLSGQNR